MTRGAVTVPAAEMMNAANAIPNPKCTVKLILVKILFTYNEYDEWHQHQTAHIQTDR